MTKGEPHRSPFRFHSGLNIPAGGSALWHATRYQAVRVGVLLSNQRNSSTISAVITI